MRDIVKAILGDVLGWDPFFEVTGEYSVKGQYAVKSIDMKLDEKHLYQWRVRLIDGPSLRLSKNRGRTS